MSKKTKKSTKASSKRTTSRQTRGGQHPAAAARLEAMEYERDGAWAKAVEAWERAARSAATRKEEKDAAGRAAAARVRADAQRDARVEPTETRAQGAGEAQEDGNEGEEADSAGAMPTEASAPPAGSEIPKDDDKTEAGGKQAAKRPRGTPSELLPPIGTRIEKKDRNGNVRCACERVEGGFRYGANVYKSLTAAAMAAARDLQLGTKAINGLVFWGLKKPARPAADATAGLERAFERYRERAVAACRQTPEGETRQQVEAKLKAHVATLSAIAEGAYV